MKLVRYLPSLESAYNLFILFSLCLFYLMWCRNNDNSWLLNHPYGHFNIFVEESRDENQWCHIPQLNPFDPSILEHLAPPSSIVCRSTQRDLTFIDANGTLRFNESAFQGSLYSKSSLNCRYSEVFKYNDGMVDTFKESEAKPFSDHVDVSHTDFVKVSCTNYFKIPIYSYVHAHIAKVNVSHTNECSSDGKYNVLVFMIDSLSRQQMIRQLPKTYGFFNNTLRSITMKGYMKVGDNTFPNLASVLTGVNPLKKPQPFEPDAEAMKPLDPWPFIWKNFSQEGYRTMFCEDIPKLNAFHYKHSGFLNQPTDHYLRPFWLAVESSFNHFISSPLCYSSRPKHQIQMDYVESFVKAYNGVVPFWGLSFLTEISHDHIGTVGAIDDDLVRFFSNLRDGKYLDNTFVFFLSDHGNRMNSIRHTYVGSVENNMPVNMILVPKTFRENHPTYVDNLIRNSKRLTSHYDIHETILDIQRLGSSKCLDTLQRSSKFARSLFFNVPRNRTCSEAGVPLSYCSCMTVQEMDHQSEEVSSGAKYLMEVINRMIGNFSDGHLCAELKFSSVKHAYELQQKRPMSTSGTKPSPLLRIMIEADPSGGMFEAVVKVQRRPNGKFDMSVLGEIDRVNKYGNQPHCITDRTMKLYCYCK